MARFLNSASWSGTQWNVAVDRIASTGSIGSGSPQVGHHILDTVAEAGKALPGCLDHGRRPIERDHPGHAAPLRPGAPSRGQCRSRHRAPVRRRSVEGDRGSLRPNVSSGRRHGRRCGHPSRAASGIILPSPSGLRAAQPEERHRAADAEQEPPSEHGLVERLDRGLADRRELRLAWRRHGAG